MYWSLDSTYGTAIYNGRPYITYPDKDDKLLVNFTNFTYGQSLCVRVAEVKFK